MKTSTRLFAAATAAAVGGFVIAGAARAGTLTDARIDALQQYSGWAFHEREFDLRALPQRSERPRLAARGTQAAALTVPTFVGADPSISSPGYPDFWAANFSASLRKNSAGTVYTLTIDESNPNIGVFNFPGGAYLVGNEEVELTAHFD